MACALSGLPGLDVQCGAGLAVSHAVALPHVVDGVEPVAAGLGIARALPAEPAAFAAGVRLNSQAVTSATEGTGTGILPAVRAGHPAEGGIAPDQAQQVDGGQVVAAAGCVWLRVVASVASVALVASVASFSPVLL
jgi:hypothetical protein